VGYLIWRQVSNWSLNWKKEKIKWKKIKTLPGPQFPLSAHLKKPLARPMKPLIARPRFPTGLQAGPVWQPLRGGFPPSRCLCRTGPIRQWLAKSSSRVWTPSAPPPLSTIAPSMAATFRDLLRRQLSAHKSLTRRSPKNRSSSCYFLSRGHLLVIQIAAARKNPLRRR
jgi:hypothetical protein